VRDLRVAWQADNRTLRTKLQDVAVSSDRDVLQCGIRWVFSVATMPDDEMKHLLDSHYPTVAEAMRRRVDHERASGHSLKGWWILRHYGFDERE
jgi:hypothetical protein